MAQAIEAARARGDAADPRFQLLMREALDAVADGLPADAIEAPLLAALATQAHPHGSAG